MIFCALLVNAHKVHAQEEAPPETSWDADPLDVLEPKKEHEVVEPTVPEFKEIPESGSTDSAPAIQHSDIAEPAPQDTQLAQPQQTVPATPAAPMGNDPDYAQEAKFNRIYKKYNEQPTSTEAWEKASGKRAAETYQVQKGNTLWDISTTFFGDPNFWPKIWSFNNGAIGNPHEIDPKMSIRFFAGDMSDAPTVELAEGSGEKDQLVDSSKTDASLAGVTIPAKKKKREPVLKTLPGSLPSKRFGIFLDEKPKVEVQVPPKVTSTGLEYLGYYLNDGPIAGVGVVTATELDLKSAGDFVYIYVRLDQGGGKDFVVEKNMAMIDDPTRKKRQAQMVEVQGQIEVLEKVNDQKNIYRAIVKKAIQPVEVGSLLIPGQLPMIDPRPSSLASGPGARIIGGQLGTNRSIFASNSLVFLDAGTNSGLQEGQTFGIFADEAVRNRQTDAIINDRQIGLAKIVKVSNGFATAYITSSTDDILKGDYVGQVVKSAKNMPVQDTPAADVGPAPSTNNSNDDLEKEFESLDSGPVQSAPSSGGTDDSDLEL
ncbi:hypothetical protein DOE51_12335 [Bdellovibrio sp. NC01]|nr:hypothetical protein DOE51_12335 [Bdellovibrio sp. NC01]